MLGNFAILGVELGSSTVHVKRFNWREGKWAQHALPAVSKNNYIYALSKYLIPIHFIFFIINYFTKNYRINKNIILKYM